MKARTISGQLGDHRDPVQHGLPAIRARRTGLRLIGVSPHVPRFFTVRTPVSWIRRRFPGNTAGILVFVPARRA